MAQRVGLLTLPLHTNYGGIIQIAALYQFLAQNGKQPLFLRRKPIASPLRVLVSKLLFHIPWQNIAGARERERLRAVHYPFIDQFMPNATKTIRTSEDLVRVVKNDGLEAVVVGSDQVWRPDYLQNATPMTYFLDFVDPTQARRISYAASFGHGRWMFPEYQNEATTLLSDFHAISVREKSGATICNETFDREGVSVVLDPTLLVDRSFYDAAVAPGVAFSKPTVLKYVLDDTEFVRKTTSSVVDLLGGGDISVKSLLSDYSAGSLDIPHWIQAFRDADWVITDSYHGTIFAILFRKPFVTIPNYDRGVDRFTTLLESLELETRLLDPKNPGDLSGILSAPIDYDAVEARLKPHQKRSADFLLSALD